ncbi:polysialyltransferase family glycosyltransferase [Methanothermobacter wolfeii]|uniref:polysialyltransferase family glycosyltransferase n=1 Tax=Methanothermobacter wolfeii TaxID=145261 RepID=UPI0024B33C20|nr:polysialyltransferase family glycosyltransferase [Methanothermobacter wolfeii]MDI6701658.1 polysialyltransferase family glycosyltransferase [Methanothermobacter wolfeii]
MRYFLATTPYNVLISYSIAMKSEKNTLILLPYFRGDGFIDVLNDSNSEDGVFDDIIMLKPYKGIKSGFLEDIRHRIDIYLHNRDVIESIPLKNSEVFIFNDTIFECQLLMSRNREHDGKNYYVEDGLAAYLKRPDPRVPEFMHPSFILKKIIGRGRYFYIKHQATHPLLDGCLVNYPELLRDDIKLEVRRLPCYSEKLADSGFISRIASYYRFSSIMDDSWMELCIIFPGSLREISVIYGVPLQTLIDLYLRIIKILRERMNVIIKFHPRESADVIERIMSTDESIISVDPAVPSEILVTYPGDCLKAIVGDISTTLVSSRTITGASVISTSGMLRDHIKKENLKEWNKFISLMKTFKIEIPKEISGLVKLIE